MIGNETAGDGLQLEGLRRRNAATVLRTVRTRGPLARSEIATAVGLSPTAVTKITTDLVRAGFVAEVRETVAPPLRPPGRPRVPVELDRSRHRILGVHIGLRRVTAGLVDLGGRVVAQRFRSHASTRPDVVTAAARRLVREVLAAQSEPVTVLGYGVCSGGRVSPEDGLLHEFTALGWRDVALRDGLTLDGLPVPTVDSSVRALALAEARLGAAQGVDNVLYLFVGNVIGCAHVLHGQIARGRHAAAGTIDHLLTARRTGILCSCGRRDCLWAVASDAALLTTAAAGGLIPADSHIEDLVMLARDGSAGARELLATRAEHIGTAVGALLDLYDPEAIVIGGGVRLAEEHFPALIAAARKATTLPQLGTPILPTALQGQSSLVQGAAAPALDAFYDDPLALADLP